MIINHKKLMAELRAAGIQIGGCNTLGIVWGIDGVTEIQTRADVAAIIAAHNPVDTIAPVAKTLEAEAHTLIKAIPNWVEWDTTTIVNYINTEATTVAKVKPILVAMAKMLVALRDKNFPDIVAQERQG